MRRPSASQARPRVGARLGGVRVVALGDQVVQLLEQLLPVVLAVRVPLGRQRDAAGLVIVPGSQFMRCHAHAPALTCGGDVDALAMLAASST